MSWNICKMPDCEAYTARPDGDYCESCRRLNAKTSESTKKQADKRAKIIAKNAQKNMDKLEKIKAMLNGTLPKSEYPLLIHIPNVSKKRQEINKKYFKLVEQFKKDNPECKAQCNEYCTKTTDDPHHKNGRGKYLLDVSTWLPCCRSCHSYIEAHPNYSVTP